MKLRYLKEIGTGRYYIKQNNPEPKKKNSMYFLFCLKPGLQVYICSMPMFMWVRADV